MLFSRSASVVIAVGFIAACVTGTTATHALETPDAYVARMASECSLDVSGHVLAAVSSYTTSPVGGGAVIDCVPFHLQPSLRSGLPVVFPTSRPSFVADGDEVIMPSMKSSTPCPDGTVGITRFARCPAPKSAPPTLSGYEQPSAQPQLGSTNVNHTGYYYVIPQTYNAAGANYSYVILSVGADVPLAKCADNGACHSLNQLWWTSPLKSPSNKTLNLCTLETGQISSNYFTQDVTTSIFAFSTNDTYAGDKQDQYNLGGGFTAVPSSPITLGAPMDKVQWQLMYEHDDSLQAYALWARSFSEPIPNKFTYAAAWQMVGYYHFSRYPLCPEFVGNQAGCEMYHTTMDVSASGRILGWGTSLGAQTSFGKFQPVPTGSGFYASYEQQVWSPDNKFASPELVEFKGTPSQPL